MWLFYPSLFSPIPLAPRFVLVLLGFVCVLLRFWVCFVAGNNGSSKTQQNQTTEKSARLASASKKSARL
jgi:hypothetical protein